MARLGVWVALALLTLYLVFFGGGWQGIYTSELRSITITLAGVVLATWAIVALRRPEWRPQSALMPAILACLASLAISTAFSRHPRLSIEYLGYAIVLAALYLLLVRILANPWFRARMATLATALAVVIGVLFLVLIVGHWIVWWGLVGRITVPPLRPYFESLVYGNPAAVMTMSVLLTISAVGSIGFASRGRIVVSGALVILSGLVTVMSGSRAGWIGVAVTIVVTSAIALGSPSGRRLAQLLIARIRGTTTGRIAFGLVALVALVGLIGLGPAILRRALEGGENLRGIYVAIALRLFGESPLVGVGPGLWVASRTTYTRPPEIDYYIPHAHDIWLQTPAELGLVGLVAGLIVLASLIWLVRGGLRDATESRRTLAWATLFGLLYFGTHQVFDFYLNMPAVLFAAVLPVAWLDATTDEAPRVGRWHLPVRLGTASTALAIVLVATAVGGLWLAEIPAARHSEAVALANKGEWRAADGPAQEAVRLDPEWPPYEFTMGLTALRVGDPDRAAAAFKAVVAVDDLPEAWLGLAAAESARGRTADALAAIRRSLRLGYQRPATTMAAGDLAFRLGDRALAVSTFAQAVTLVPSLAADPYLGYLSDPALIADVVEAALRGAPPSGGWEIALMAGYADTARSIAADLEPEAASFAMDVIDAWTKGGAAAQVVFDRCSTAPLDLNPLPWCARLEGRAGNAEGRERYRSWGDAIIGGAGASGAELRVSTEELIGRSVEGEVASFWGTYTYRRPTAWDLLATGLVHLTLK